MTCSYEAEDLGVAIPHLATTTVYLQILAGETPTQRGRKRGGGDFDIGPDDSVVPVFKAPKKKLHNPKSKPEKDAPSAGGDDIEWDDVLASDGESACDEDDELECEPESGVGGCDGGDDVDVDVGVIAPDDEAEGAGEADASPVDAAEDAASPSSRNSTTSSSSSSSSSESEPDVVVMWRSWKLPCIKHLISI